MLTITVLGEELFDNDKEEFVRSDGFELQLEHSLVSLSKWEEIYEKPFLSATEKTTEETLAYVYAMILTPNVSPDVVEKLSSENFQEINDYIEAKMTATWFSENKNEPKSTQTITAELIYYWMNTCQIPLECETWHLNRLFTLIKVHSLQNAKPKKMGRNDIRQQQRELNAQRRAKTGSSG